MTNFLGNILLAGVLLSCQPGFAQTITGQTAGLENTPNGKVVKAWYTAWEKADWNLLTHTLADGFTFSSPLDDHINLSAVQKRCWPNAGKFKSIDVEQLTMNGDDVVVIQHGYTTAGKFIRNCDYFKVKDGKITAYECFFGPGINFPNNSEK